MNQPPPEPPPMPAPGSDPTARTEAEASSARLPAEQVGDQIGPYKLLQRLGEGGQGMVYLAEQAEPRRRQVALKILKAELASQQVVGRFEAELAALRRMDHPNIAKVFDAGTTTTGRPYFVMELIRGAPITGFCDQHQLPTVRRLELFLQVCAAVQHAHQKGIIHRDLKPSNILVTFEEQTSAPKLIDFGIAKSIEQPLTEKPMFTAIHQAMGTPAYMSPEQAGLSGRDIDTRGDIYSLGVLLYELLTGKTPFEAQELWRAGLDEMRRIIREREPARPSARLAALRREEQTSIAERRRCPAPKLIQTVNGDLDWIVMKCLEKDRTRRYDSASALAADLSRHLGDEPVIARPPGNWYRLSKLVRRNRLAFGAAAAVASALILGLGGATWGLLKEKAARTRAEAAEKKSGRVSDFLKKMLEGVGPSVALGRDTELLGDLLADAENRLATDLKNEPGLEADLAATIGKVYFELGNYQKAMELDRRVLELRKRVFGAAHPSVVEAQNDLAIAHFHKGDDYAESSRLFEEALAMAKNLPEPEPGKIALLKDGIGNVRFKQGKFTQAEALHRSAAAMQTTLHGTRTNMATANSLFGLANALYRQGSAAQCDESERLYAEVLAIRQAILGANAPLVATTLNNRGIMFWEREKLAEAERDFREALRLRRKLFPKGHPDVAATLGNLGMLLYSNGNLDESEKFCREEVAIKRDRLGTNHVDYSTGIEHIAFILWSKAEKSDREDEWKEAIDLERESLAIKRQRLGSNHLDVANSLLNLAGLLREARRTNEIEAIWREELRIRRGLGTNGLTGVAQSVVELARSLAENHQAAAAEKLVRDELANEAGWLPAQWSNLSVARKADLRKALLDQLRACEQLGATNAATEFREKLAIYLPAPEKAGGSNRKP